jgi:hypothetical protein
MRRWFTAAGLVSVMMALLVGVHSVAAHHSAAMFDFSQRLTLNGTLKEMRWTNPHVSLLVYGATQPGAEPTDWLLETTSPSILVRLGWSRTSIRPGDKVSAKIAPLFDRAEHGGTLEEITLVDSGKTFGTNNREQEHPNLQ